MVEPRIWYAVMTIVGSVCLYTCVRVLKKYHVSSDIQNMLMFLPASFFFLGWAWYTGKSLLVGWEAMVVIGIIVVFLSRLPNKMSLQSIETSPNIGYSLMIGKSYVILTSLVAVPLLGAELTWSDIIAILLIVYCLSLLLLDPVSGGDSRSFKMGSWVLPAIYSHIGRAGLALSTTWVIFHYGMDPTVFNFRLFSICGTAGLCETFFSGTLKDFVSTRLHLGVWLSCLGIVFSMIIFNQGLVYGYATSPNPGYINAANASSIAVLTLISFFIFGDELSIRKLIGVVGVLGGMCVLFLY